jgi:ATP-dependent Clp protease protease subunit
MRLMAKAKSRKHPVEIAAVGDVDQWEADAIKAMLEAPPGSECVFYIDSAGGSVYSSLAIVALLKFRKLRGTAVVLGECSSAALLVFAACPQRYVTPMGTFLFHRMRWQSEKRIAAEEAHHWATHFRDLESDLDELQARLFGPAHAQVREWTRAGKYLSGRQLVAARLAELIEL